MKKTFSLLAIVLLTTSCNNQNEPISIPTDAKPIALRVELQKRVNQDNEFAFDFLKQTIASSGETDVFVSPLSLSIALGMAWNGANGNTKTGIETALKMNGMSVADINDYYQIMQSTLPGIDPTTKLSIANSLWYKTGFSVKSDFLKVNTDYFGAYIKDLDFDQTWAKDTINNWCSKKTNNLIPAIIDQIPSGTMMYLVNAVYFKGIWRKQFDKKNTTEDNFTNESGSTLKVNMMYQKDTFEYTIDDKAQYLDLPYGNKAYSMTIILPLENKTTSDILSSLTVENWTATLGNLATKEVMLYLPRFKVENKFLLNDPLKNMGMKLAFSDFADFSNISSIPLQISDVVQKTYITVDEEGTEAAAVTSIGVIASAMPQYTIFKVNKPFIYVIREKSTGVILFIGKMGNVDKF